MSVENARRVLQRERNPHLFRALNMRTVTARNRIMMSPMCQYSAEDGLPNEWHSHHLATRAVGGAGIVCVEASHVEARGRITKYCLGLWNDAQRDRLAAIAAFVAQQGAVPGIQLAHAGRKGSATRPWEGTLPLQPNDGAWQTLGPSPLPYADGFPAPRQMDASLIEEVVDAFRQAARRAHEAGFKFLELHAGHGYLLHEFLSPLSNQRVDRYGGPRENRMRFLMETVAAVRTTWPRELPLSVRLSVTDWVEGGWDVEDSIALARALKATGDVDLIDASGGGLDPRQRIPVHPGYQVPFAERIRRDTGIATAAVGLISSPEAAEEIIANGRADLVVLGRMLLNDPYWPLHAAKTLRTEVLAWPVQYERANIY